MTFPDEEPDSYVQTFGPIMRIMSTEHGCDPGYDGDGLRAPLAASLSLALLCGCAKRTQAPAIEDGAVAAPQFLTKSFGELYPIFLVYSSMPQGDKARLWAELRDHWVRWDGAIVSFNDKGVTLKQLLTTMTFDVSLTCEAPAGKTLRSRFQVGDRVRYVGRLENYDDVFRTLYLTHGAILEKLPPGDLGMPADLAH